MGSQITPGLFRWALAIDDSRLFFQTWIGRGAPRYNREYKQGEFIEGLWNEDVVEFFVMNNSGGYQEFNVSPAGAWWTSSFSSYRKRSEEPVLFSPILVEAHITPAGWGVFFSLALKDISTPLLPTEARIHVSAILTGVNQQPRYLSSAPLSQSAPDFHDARCFLPIVLAS
jgi:hypothetical protein